MKVITHALRKRPFEDCSDSELFAFMANREGDLLSAEQAFAVLDSRYKRYIRKVASVYTNDKALAVEVTRDTLYKAFLNAAKFNSSKSVKAWLGTIAKNAIYDAHRGIKNSQVDFTDDVPDMSNEPEVFATRAPIELEKLRKGLAGLEPHKRDILEAYLRYFDVAQFGDNVRLPESEVKLLIRTYPVKISSKYYIPKLRDRAWEELFKKCTANN